MSDKEKFLAVPLTVEKTVDIMAAMGIGFPLDVFEQGRVFTPKKNGETPKLKRIESSYYKVNSSADLKAINPKLFVTRIGKKGSTRYIDISRKDKLRLNSLELRGVTENDITSLILAQKDVTYPILTDKELARYIDHRIN